MREEIPLDPSDTTKAPHPILRYFSYTHLPEPVQTVSKFICDLAFDLDQILPDGPEKSTALRKLLEAKDAAVRSALDL